MGIQERDLLGGRRARDHRRHGVVQRRAAGERARRVGRLGDPGRVLEHMTEQADERRPVGIIDLGKAHRAADSSFQPWTGGAILA